MNGHGWLNSKTRHGTRACHAGHSQKRDQKWIGNYSKTHLVPKIAETSRHEREKHILASKKEVETHVAGDKAASEVTPPYDKNAIAHTTTPSGSRLEQSGVADRSESAYCFERKIKKNSASTRAGTEQEQEATAHPPHARHRQYQYRSRWTLARILLLPCVIIPL